MDKQDYKVTARRFYNGNAWKECREAYIRYRQGIDGGLCEACHKEPGYIVHHKKHLDAIRIHDPQYALSFDNLMYVCKHCHDVIHGYGGSMKRPSRVIFDANGQPHPVAYPSGCTGKSSDSP